MQVIDVKELNQNPNQKSKIHSRYKLSDGVSVINGMVLEQIGKRMNGPMPINAVIEFEGYMKNKVNDKYVLIFSRAPKIVADPKSKIGSPIEYEKREKDGDFDEDKPEKVQELAAIDISLPQKKVAL